MLFDFRYLGNSSVTTSSGFSDLSFAPDTTRELPVSFRGLIRAKHSVRFREAISALHDVVVDDQRFVPKQRSNYEEWRALEDQKLLARYMADSAALRAEIDETTKSIINLEEEIEQLRRQANSRDEAIQKYYDHILEKIEI